MKSLMKGRRVSGALGQVSLLLSCVLLIPALASAQSEPSRKAAFILSGLVVDAQTGEPVPGSVVAVSGSYEVQAEDGSFLIGLPPGKSVITVSADGYLEVEVEVEGEAGSTQEIVIELDLATVSDEVRVVAQRPVETGAPVTIVEAETVFNVAGSLDNVFRTLQVLPGVAAPEDFGSRLSVRGGGPDQNLTLMDGVEVHNPYRLFGLVSAFNPETVDDFALTAGGFSARYGDRLSSLLVVENRPGNTPLTGSVAASITDANVVVEGIFPGRPGNSWLFSARRTYYDLIVGPLVDSDLPSFNDLQGRLDLGVGPGTLSFTALRSREGADISVEEDNDRADAFSDVSNDLFALRYIAPLGARTTSSTSLSWYRNADVLDFDGSFQNEARRSNTPGDEGIATSSILFARELLIEDAVLRQDLTVALGDRHILGFGADVHDLTSATRFLIEGDRNESAANGSSLQGGVGLPDQIASELTGIRGGLWVEDQISIGPRFTLTPGLRFDWSEINEESTFSPRLAMVYQVNERTRLRAAGGLYTQSPGYEKLISADYFVDLSDAAQKGILHQKASHAILGAERDLGKLVSVQLEGYYKSFDDLIIGRLETEQERALRVAQYDFPEALQGSVPTAPIITSNPSNDGRGAAYGMDLFIQRRPSSRTRWGGWVSYTLAWSDQEAYDRVFPFDYDRRNAVNVVGYYRLGRRWEIAATGRWASGFPRTAPVGLRVAATEDPEHDPDSPLPPALIPATDDDGNLIYSIDYGDTSNLNTDRLPFYARLDARVTFRPGGPSSRWMIYFEVLNLLDRDNAGALEASLVYNPNGPLPTIVETADFALPLLPTIGARYRF